MEQTTRGHRLLFGGDSPQRKREALDPPERPTEYRAALEEIGAPVVSIARCETKTWFEGPVIGAAVRTAVVARLAEHCVDLTQLDRIGVIGFGTVGREVFLRLATLLPDASIDVIECDRKKHFKIKADGGRPLSRLPCRGDYQLLVGCTGYTSFDVEDRRCLAKSATLISCSSAAVEFNRMRFVEKANELPNDEFEIRSPEPGSGDIRATISFTDGYRTIEFLHAGFPVNFDGEMEHIPYRFIQVTHALLYAAAMQALEVEGPELQWIAPATDEWVLEQALRSLEDDHPGL